MTSCFVYPPSAGATVRVERQDRITVLLWLAVARLAAALVASWATWPAFARTVDMEGIMVLLIEINI